MEPQARLDALRARLAEAVGADRVSADPAVRAAMSEDIHARGATAGLVVRPAAAGDLSAIMAAASAFGCPVIPRGGGMSYTGGCLADAPGALVIDTRDMNRILDVRAEDRIVIVEAGATWADLRAALKPLGLRTPFWGPLSGLHATVGGGVSQQNAFFGAGQWGPTSSSVTGLSVILADGRALRTGAWANGAGVPFMREGGPDLTGLFCGDCGALGIKAEIALRLIPEPDWHEGASFAFSDPDALARAMADAARTGLASEICAFDAALADMRLRRANLAADTRTLAAVARGRASLADGLIDAARVALAGRRFLETGSHSLHFVCEGASKPAVAAALAALRGLMRDAGGREIDNTIPTAMRAAPFTPLNNILGPEGQFWAPIHGIVPMGRGPACWAELRGLFAAQAAAMAELGIEAGFLGTTLSTTGYLIEPVLIWPDARFALHESTVEPGWLARLPALPENPAARAKVWSLRAGILEIFARHGAEHFQNGRTYGWAERRDPIALATVRHMKTLLDPKGLINPGVLGL